MNIQWYDALSPHWGTLFSLDPQSHFMLAKVEGFLDAAESAEKSVSTEGVAEPLEVAVENGEEVADGAVEEVAASTPLEESIESVSVEPVGDGSVEGESAGDEPISDGSAEGEPVGEEPISDGSAEAEPAGDASLLAKLEEVSRAAEQGNVMAQYYLGAMYATGNGEVAQDCDTAAYWYTKAADQGLAMAQNNLGFLYATGQGVPQDYLTAYMWITLAVMGEYPDAANNLNILAKYMTPEQIEQAQERAHAWQAAFEQR